MAEYRIYNLHGVPLCVEACNGEFLHALDRLIGVFAETGDGQPAAGDAFILEPHVWSDPRSLPNIPVDEYQPWGSITGKDGLTASWYAKPGMRATVLEDSAVVVNDLHARCCRIDVVGDRMSNLAFACLIPILSDVLAEHDQFLLHAAGVCTSSNRAALMFGDSGAGKTTAALALAGVAMPLMCDDACFLCAPTDCEPYVWPLPRDANVHENTIRLLPHLADLPSRPGFEPSERVIRFEDLTDIDPRDRFFPEAIVLLQARNGDEHRLEPIEPVRLLPELLRRNVRALETDAAGAAGRMFRALSRLTRDRPGFFLSIGPDLDSLPQALQAAVAK